MPVRHLRESGAAEGLWHARRDARAAVRIPPAEDGDAVAALVRRLTPLAADSVEPLGAGTDSGELP